NVQLSTPSYPLSLHDALPIWMPAGPVHDFPASNSQGLGIPKNAKNKKAAWEFIKWALSPEISMRLVKEHGHSSVCRRSVIESERSEEHTSELQSRENLVCRLL